MSETTLFEKNGLTLTGQPPNPESLQSILILTMNRHDNRFSEDMVTTFNEILDLLDTSAITSKYTNPILIITGTGKFFSNGLDLKGIAKRKELMIDTTVLLSRVLVLGMPTIAAINGHGFGAGLFLALCCDWRVMRNDRGYLCFPESDLSMPFSWGFAKVVTDKINDKLVARDASLLSKRYTAKQALEDRLVDKVSDSLDTLMKDSVEYGHRLLYKKKFMKDKYSQMKGELYTNAYLALKNYQFGDSPRYIGQKTSKL